jgi:hypothetical protein
MEHADCTILAYTRILKSGEPFSGAGNGSPYFGRLLSMADSERGRTLREYQERLDELRRYL